MALERTLPVNSSDGQQHHELIYSEGKSAFPSYENNRTSLLMNQFRSAEKGKKLCQELMESSPGSVAIYLKVDVSLLRNVDAACEELQRREKKINVLFLTAGYMTLKGRNGKFFRIPLRKTNSDRVYRNTRRHRSQDGRELLFADALYN